jgi:hypothetical protein
MTNNPASKASNRARTRLAQKYKEEFDLLYQEELNKLGIKTRKQQQDEVISTEKIQAWFDSGPITEETLRVWLSILQKAETK